MPELNDFRPKFTGRWTAFGIGGIFSIFLIQQRGLDLLSILYIIWVGVFVFVALKSLDTHNRLVDIIGITVAIIPFLYWLIPKLF